MKIEMISPDKLSFAEYNPRSIKTPALDRLKKSLNSSNGLSLFERRPILVNKRDGKLIVYAGNQRLKAARELGFKTVPVIVDEISIEEEKERNIKDNLSVGDWDSELLEANFDLKNLEEWGMDLQDVKLSIDPEEEKDEVPEPPKEARAKLGEVYTLGRHRLMCGDSTMIDDVEKLMAGHKADMVFTDPPYGVNFTEKAKRLGRKGLSDISGDESIDSMKEVVSQAFLNISLSIKDGAPYYICAPQGGDQEMMMMMMMREAGIKCRHQLIWKKTSPVFSMGRLDYDYQHEPILYGWKASHSHYGNGEFKTSVWECERQKDKESSHPTMKPVKLVLNAILNSSKADDVVLDLFLGSGTTLIASQQSGRLCFGMELDPRYCDVIIKRYCNLTGANEEEIYASAMEKAA